MLSKLFEPASIGTLRIKNRFVRSATWEGMAAEDGSCTSRLVELTGDLAKGEVGLIVSGHALIRRCLAVFSKELKDFDPTKAVYNFAYNASTPELEEWLATQVQAFRTGGGAINPLPHKGQVKLTCTSFGPGNCEDAIDREIERLLARESGWLIFNTHGLDDEGWGPIRATYLDRLLDKLLEIESVDVLPAGRALRDYVDDQTNVPVTFRNANRH